MASSASEGNLGNTLALAAGGDAQAWRVIVESYSSRVFGLVARQCGDRELAEEITQATFVQIVTHLAGYKEQGQFEPWLFRIAMNRLRDEMRRRKRQARTVSLSDGDGGETGGEQAWSAVQGKIVDRHGGTPASPLEQVSQSEQIVLLRAAIAQLPEADQEILHLRHTAGLSFPEIAQTLEQPLGTVLARGHRALAKVRKMMHLDEA